MASADESLSMDAYTPTLADYLHSHSESALYHAGLLSRSFIENGLGPEDIIALHFEALEKSLEGMSYREQARASADAHQFLLEVMIAYGVQYKDYLELRLAETLRDADARALRERERAMHAERLEREKGEILGVIAHELNTPITVAKGNLDLLRRSVSRGSYDAVPRYVGTAQEAIERLSRLTADLVEASRGEPPRLAWAACDLTDILAKAVAWATSAAASKGVALDCADAENHIVLSANADALLSVFGNLLSNAIRYTPAGGTVRVHQEIQDAWAVVEIVDTGIGMSPEVRERIFEKFYRGPDAREVASRGLGLGLSLVQQLIAAHGGVIEVESTVGEGSIFRVRLPLARGESKEGKA